VTPGKIHPRPRSDSESREVGLRQRISLQNQPQQALANDRFFHLQFCWYGDVSIERGHWKIHEFSRAGIEAIQTRTSSWFLSGGKGSQSEPNQRESRDCEQHFPHEQPPSVGLELRIAPDPLGVNDRSEAGVSPHLPYGI